MSLAAVAAMVTIVAIPYHRPHRVSVKGSIALPRHRHRLLLRQCRRRRRCFLATQPSRYDNQPHHTNTHPYLITTTSPHLTSPRSRVSCRPTLSNLFCTAFVCSHLTPPITIVSFHRTHITLITSISPISVINSVRLLTSPSSLLSHLYLSFPAIVCSHGRHC